MQRNGTGALARVSVSYLATYSKYGPPPQHLKPTLACSMMQPVCSGTTSCQDLLQETALQLLGQFLHVPSLCPTLTAPHLIRLVL